MTDEPVNYDIQQVQHDIERLQRDLSRLQNDAASAVTSSRYEPAVLYDPLRAEENVLEHSIVSTENAQESNPILVNNLTETETISAEVIIACLNIPTTPPFDEKTIDEKLIQEQKSLMKTNKILLDKEIIFKLQNQIRQDASSLVSSIEILTEIEHLNSSNTM
jgi:hypothetical protein